MSKRLKYTKDILTHMLTNNGAAFNDDTPGTSFKPTSKRSLHRFASTTGFQKSNPGSSNNIAKYNAGEKFRTLSRGTGSEKKLFKTNYFGR